MKFVVVWAVLFVLSFSTLHDIFLSTIDNKDPKISHFVMDSDPLLQYTEINEVHNLLHFIAILDFDQVSLNILSHFTLLSEQKLPSTAPVIETSYKPPIV